MSDATLSDYVNEERSKHRPIEEIAADIGELDRKIGELNSQRTQLVAEHDKAARVTIPTIF